MVVALDAHLEFERIWQYDGTVAEGMGTDSRQYHYPQTRENDRTAGAQCMSCRARWGRHDQTVSAVCAKGFVSGDYMHIEHAAECPLDDHNVVESPKMFFRSPMLGGAHNHRFEGYPAVDFVVALNYPRERRACFVSGYFGKKPKTAEINPQYRRFAFAHHTCHAQQCAITSQHHQEVGLASKLGRFCRTRANNRGGQRFAERVEPPRLDPGGEFGGESDRVLRPVRPHHQPD